MKEIRSLLCKYATAGNFCDYCKEIKVFDGETYNTYNICSYIGDECLYDKE